LSQGEFENRDIERTLNIGWDILSELPREELLRINQDLIKKYLDPLMELKETAALRKAS
jgi:V/A-type H+-transporting ATPase subunit B